MRSLPAQAGRIGNPINSRFVSKPEAIAPAFSLCTRRPGESEDCHQGCSSQVSGDCDNLSDNLCILMVSQPLGSLVAR